jgi:putative ABC transport system ATP-binding protein
LEILKRPEAKERAAELLARMGLADRAHHFPHQLSGGEQQRVAIARALAASPKLLFADEPTGNLDEATAAAVEDLLFGLIREQGLAAVIVTHNADLARRCARVLRLHAGRFA